MFKQLIRRELPKKLHDLYRIARREQPGDCLGLQCPHRDKLRPTDLEWMHQMRRELKELAVSDGRRNGMWRMK
jgi:hypothetical protein